MLGTRRRPGCASRLNERNRLMSASRNIVLVHGAWADGSCWSEVIERLQADGYKVTAPQIPETSLADDVARLRHVLTARTARPSSWALLRRADHHRARHGRTERRRPRLHRRRSGSTRESRSARCSAGRPRPRRWRISSSTPQGFGWLPEDEFVAHFAADVDPIKAKVMYAVQQPLHNPRSTTSWARPPGSRCPRGTSSPQTTRRSHPTPSASSRPGWAPTRSRWQAGQCAMISHPDETVERIETAANAVLAPA